MKTEVKREGLSSASEDDATTQAKRKAQLAAATKLKDTESPLVGGSLHIVGIFSPALVSV